MSPLGVEAGAKVRILVWASVAVRLLRDSRLFVDPGVPAATGRTLSSSRETLSHHGATSGLLVMTASLVGYLGPGL